MGDSYPLFSQLPNVSSQSIHARDKCFSGAQLVWGQMYSNALRNRLGIEKAEKLVTMITIVSKLPYERKCSVMVMRSLA